MFFQWEEQANDHSCLSYQNLELPLHGYMLKFITCVELYVFPEWVTLYYMLKSVHKGMACLIVNCVPTVEVDIDDSSTRTPYRTPFGTPPQRYVRLCSFAMSSYHIVI